MPELLLYALAVLIYLLPWIIAAVRNHANLAPIALVNILLGWTLLGWIVALIWSATDNVVRPKATA